MCIVKWLFTALGTRADPRWLMGLCLAPMGLGDYTLGSLKEKSVVSLGDYTLGSLGC